MRRKAVLVHLNGLVRVTPLAGGYLKAYAQADPAVREDWEIELYGTYARTPASEVLQHLVRAAPAVLGFSVYTWNVGLVLRLVEALRGVLPAGTRYLLGGPEVMHRGDRTVPGGWEDVATCNGEGEKTFRQFLLEAGEARPDLERVGGLSFWRDGQWRTTAAHERIRDLAEIPSPWLSGVFDDADLADVALFETNRGCPFACEFCYWGGAVGTRVNRIELERVKAELDYVAARRTRTLVLCDANFGMLPRDLEIAEHIARLRGRSRSPSRVCYSSAKNHPERAEAVATIFSNAHLLQNQSISLQTLSPEALRRARRENIDAETYFRLQKRLNAQRVPSFVELIWPLPGETLDSFEDGVDRLCATGAQAFAVYPLLWLHNVGYDGKEEEYGIATLREDDPSSGGRIVVRTNEVGFDDYLSGLEFATSLFLLHDCRGLYVTMHVLRALGIASHREVIRGFSQACAADGESGLARLWRRGRQRFEDMVRYEWTGELAYHALEAGREDTDRLLRSFVEAQTAWHADPERSRLVTAALELDLLARPYVYLHPRLEVGGALRELAVTARARRSWTVEAPYDFPTLVARLRAGDPLRAEELRPKPSAFRIVHEGHQALRAERPAPEHHMHCHQIVREIGVIEPRLEASA